MGAGTLPRKSPVPCRSHSSSLPRTLRDFKAALVGLGFVLALSLPLASAQGLLPAPPNVVTINEHLITAGQPSAAWLETLSQRGIEAVIYLAPLSVGDAVPEEPHILARQGIEFVHIPITFNQPTGADFDRFTAAMTAMQGKKVLVHCQVNMRASSMVFLYRTIVLKEDAQRAYEDVGRVWVPNGVWLRFIQAQLREKGVTFDVL